MLFSMKQRAVFTKGNVYALARVVFTKGVHVVDISFLKNKKEINKKKQQECNNENN